MMANYRGGTDSRGYSGSEYDRYVDRYDDSTVSRMRQHFWTAKQAIRSKLGKEEDQHLVASDSEFDAKLTVFFSIKSSCENMLKTIENYQDFICDLTHDENAWGRFLKHRGKADKSRAGKMMVALGRAESYTAQQRLALRVPLVRLYQELEVFTERAVGDCQHTVTRAQRARVEYRGSLLWMKKVSEDLDPDTFRQLEKYRKVQAAVRRNKAKFDKHKLDCLQKIDLLAASRCNLFSQLLVNYQTCLANFWDRTSNAHKIIADNFKGHQPYEFTILKDLAEPSDKSIAASLEKKVQDDHADENDQIDTLISLEGEEDPENFEQKSAEDQFMIDKSPEAEDKPVDDLLGLGSGNSKKSAASAAGGVVPPHLPPPPNWSFSSIRAQKKEQEQENQKPSEIEEMLALSISETAEGDTSSFTYQWEHLQAGDDSRRGFSQLFEPEPPREPEPRAQQPMPAAPTASEIPNIHDSPTHFGGQKQLLRAQGVLPSQLMDFGQTDKKSEGDKNWAELFEELDPLKNPSSAM